VGISTTSDDCLRFPSNLLSGQSVALPSTKQQKIGTDSMSNDQLFPTDWETQKVLLNDFYGFGKAEITVVFISMLNDYIKEQEESNPEFTEKHQVVFDKVKEILSDAKKHCRLTLEGGVG